ncbi:MAG TPA: ABC transporter substrate-binding protein [Streptosporangiaceae bacterium]|nr:ABC transporter substrate-binding protein [Streptosporangiaceae bacterium]
MDIGRNIDHERLDDLRRGHGPVQEHIIDEFVAGRLARRDFIRKGTAIGLSLPLISGILAACGSSNTTTPSSSGTAAAGKAGATIKAGFITPVGAINPITINDQGGLELLGNVAEFLVFTDHSGIYHPWLATSWSANSDASVWTFKIRQGVKFSNGSPMTVDDVVYSFQTQSDPKSSGNALSQFGGFLTPDGVKKVDDQTVAFHLSAPNNGFVDSVSEDNYNMVVVPKGTDYGNYQKSPVGTGRFVMSSYSPSVGATLTRNPHYWGTKALPSKVEVTFYATEEPMASALEAGSIDAMDQFSVATSPQLLTGGFNVISVRGAAQRQLSMRNDIKPFTNKLVRQAIALTLDRPGIVAALFKGQAVVGNDSPFAPNFAATNHSVPQRTKNIAQAKKLLAQAGVPNGFSTPLLTENIQEIPHFAQIIKQSAAQIGVTINLTIEAQSKYYGDGVVGKSDWLDGEMSLVDYGARSVPNLYLAAPLQTINTKTGEGAWNAARFNDPTYNKLSKQFIATVDLQSQKNLAGQIQRLLLDETPIIWAYFYNYLAATAKNVTGVYPTAQGQFFLWNAAKS